MVICLGTTPALQRTMIYDELKLDSVNRTSRVREYASGKGTNVARVLNTLNVRVLVTGFLGGERGKLYRAELDEARIPHDFYTVGPATRMCITVVDQVAGTATELLEEAQPLLTSDFEGLLGKLPGIFARAESDPEWRTTSPEALVEEIDEFLDEVKSGKKAEFDPNSYRARLADTRRPEGHSPRTELLIISGNLPPGANPDFYARCLKLAPPNTKAIVDTVGAPLLAAFEHKPFLIKPNQAEVGRTLGISVETEASLRDGMKELVKRGATWVVVTRGREDTLITDGTDFWKINSPPIKVVSAIGSGDAFAAGLAKGLLRDAAVPVACLLGVACGAANALTPDAGHLHYTDVAKLRAKVRLVKT